MRAGMPKAKNVPCASPITNSASTVIVPVAIMIAVSSASTPVATC